MYKSLVTHKNKKTRLHFVRKHIKEPTEFWKRFFGQMNPRLEIRKESKERKSS